MQACRHVAKEPIKRLAANMKGEQVVSQRSLVSWTPGCVAVLSPAAAHVVHLHDDATRARQGESESTPRVTVVVNLLKPQRRPSCQTEHMEVRCARSHWDRAIATTYAVAPLPWRPWCKQTSASLLGGV